MIDQEESPKPQADVAAERAPGSALTLNTVSQTSVSFSERVEDGELGALFLRLELEVERGDYKLARRSLDEARGYVARQQLADDVVVVEAMSHYNAKLSSDPMAAYVLLLCVLIVAMIAVALFAR